LPDDFDQTALLCDPFYQPVAPLGRDSKGRPIVRPGQLIWAHQVYPPKDPYIVHVQGYDLRDDSKTSYVIRKLDPQRPPGTHFPIKELELRADENYYILLGKNRPAVVVQTVSSISQNNLYPEPYVWVAPAFSFKPRHEAEFRYRVAAMEFPHLFYLPSHVGGLSQPSVLRFEFIQPVALAGVQPLFTSDGKQSALSETAWAIMLHQLVKFATGKPLDEGLEETIQAYQSLVLEEYRKGQA
jgi:hypothetical protein